MKRLLASVLAASMLISLCACAKKNNDDVAFEEDLRLPTDTGVEIELNTEIESGSSTETENAQDNKGDKSESKPQNQGGGLKVDNDKAPVIEGEKVEIIPTTPDSSSDSKPQTSTPGAFSVGSALKTTFKSAVSFNPSAPAEELARVILSNEVIQFSADVMAVEPGLLTGFDNAEIKGFSEGAMFAPMIGSIPFVGYVFTLAEGTDAKEFVSTLKKNANPRWNICTTAEETVVDYVGNKVFFVMCPISMAADEPVETEEAE